MEGTQPFLGRSKLWIEVTTLKLENEKFLLCQCRIRNTLNFQATYTFFMLGKVIFPKCSQNETCFSSSNVLFQNISLGRLIHLWTLFFSYNQKRLLLFKCWLFLAKKGNLVKMCSSMSTFCEKKMKKLITFALFLKVLLWRQSRQIK